MLTRRSLLIASAATAALASLRLPPALMPRALAQTPDQASRFVGQTGSELVAAVNGGGSDARRAAALAAVVDRTVDVEAVARFCLGRFWRTATPEQQRDYVTLFHKVLLRNITGHLGEYHGVSFTLGRTVPREGNMAVNSTILRPGTPPAQVDWVVSNASGSPKIVDVVAEGTSLRLTQRSDYASFLAQHGNNVQALIDAMRQQVGSA